jgi:hypothetical protein
LSLPRTRVQEWNTRRRDERRWQSYGIKRECEKTGTNIEKELKYSRKQKEGIWKGKENGK